MDEKLGLIISTINDIFSHYYNGIDKIFTTNFTLLAFIITAITILLMLARGKFIEFKKANLLDDAMSYFYKSLNWNFISGVFALSTWIINFSGQAAANTVSLISILLISISLYYTYQSYKFLIFFVQNQN